MVTKSKCLNTNLLVDTTHFLMRFSTYHHNIHEFKCICTCMYGLNVPKRILIGNCTKINYFIVCPAMYTHICICIHISNTQIRVHPKQPFLIVLYSFKNRYFRKICFRKLWGQVSKRKKVIYVVKFMIIADFNRHK